MAKYKNVIVTWDPTLGEWYFHLETPGFRTIGFTSEYIYFDDQDEVILATAKKWLKSIDKEASEYKISLSRPSDANKGQKISQLSIWNLKLALGPITKGYRT